MTKDYREGNKNAVKYKAPLGLRKHFCNYEAQGDCAPRLTHVLENYWVGRLKARFGAHAYFCAAHWQQTPPGTKKLPTDRPRTPRAECEARYP